MLNEKKALGVEMRLLFFIVITIFASHLRSEPSSDVRTLMEEPVSIFDWGLYRLQKMFDSSTTYALVNYDWEQNKIIIISNGIDLEKRNLTMDQTKTDCEKVFSDFDKMLLIGMENYCSFCGFFSHSGYSNERLRKAQETIIDRLHYRYFDYSNTCNRKATEKSVSISSN